MKTEQLKTCLCVLCVALPMVCAAAQTPQPDLPTIMNRVQREEDPELGDLIRLAMENRQHTKEEAFEIMRKVTQSYAQIKLLDLQIAEVSRKAESATLAEMRYELLLAAAELESKRTVELANLRETVGIIPQLPLEAQPVEALKGRVSLQLIGERFYVLEGRPPFSDFWAAQRWTVMGLLSEKETMEYVRKRLSDNENLPMLFDVYYDSDTDALARDLRNKMISVVKDTRSQMKTEIRVQRISFTGSGQSTFYLRDGSITTFYTHPMQRPDGGSEPLVTGVVNPADLEQHILSRITKPKNVPLTFRIEYDKASAPQAKQVADAAHAVVKRLNLAEIVQVEEVPVEPVAEKAFLGRWRGQTRGDVHEVDIRPDGICQVTMGDRLGKVETPESIKAGTTVQGRWFMTTNEIVIDIKDKSPWGPDYMYRGCLEKDSTLVVDKAIIYPQGTFYTAGEPRQAVLQKVE